MYVTHMHISLKSFLFCFLFLLNLFSFQKLHADRIIQSQQLVENLYNDLDATSMKELSNDEQKIELKNLFQNLNQYLLKKIWDGAMTQTANLIIN